MTCIIFVALIDSNAIVIKARAFNLKFDARNKKEIIF